LQDRNIEAHTLILGTHPSIKSLSESQYYGHTMK
jgi:G:T/U-mismatch repair DNA glycosylase